MVPAEAKAELRLLRRVDLIWVLTPKSVIRAERFACHGLSAGAGVFPPYDAALPVVGHHELVEAVVVHAALVPSPGNLHWPAFGVEIAPGRTPACGIVVESYRGVALGLLQRVAVGVEVLCFGVLACGVHLELYGAVVVAVLATIYRVAVGVGEREARAEAVVVVGEELAHKAELAESRLAVDADYCQLGLAAVLYLRVVACGAGGGGYRRCAVERVEALADAVAVFVVAHLVDGDAGVVVGATAGGVEVGYLRPVVVVVVGEELLGQSVAVALRLAIGPYECHLHHAALVVVFVALAEDVVLVGGRHVEQAGVAPLGYVAVLVPREQVAEDVASLVGGRGGAALGYVHVGAEAHLGVESVVVLYGGGVELGIVLQAAERAAAAMAMIVPWRGTGASMCRRRGSGRSCGGYTRLWRGGQGPAQGSPR